MVKFWIPPPTPSPEPIAYLWAEQFAAEWGVKIVLRIEHLNGDFEERTIDRRKINEGTTW